MKLKQYISTYISSLRHCECNEATQRGVGGEVFLLLLCTTFSFAQPTCSDSNTTNYNTDQNFTATNSGGHNITNDANSIAANNTINNAAYFANNIVLTEGFRATSANTTEAVFLSINNCVTGSYDLWVPDGIEDTGIEPNTLTLYPWTSPEIWTRNTNDGFINQTQENIEYNPNQNAYIYVKIKNRGTINYSGSGATLELYWAKASSNLAWPNSWNGSTSFPQGGITGGLITSFDITNTIAANGEVIIEKVFNEPNPNTYQWAVNSGGENWHFCLLARIVSNDDPMYLTETTSITQNVLNNNNLGWKNISVVDVIDPNPLAPPTVVAIPNATIAVGNPFHIPKNYIVEFLNDTQEIGNGIFEEAEVVIKLDDVLLNAFNNAGGFANVHNIMPTKNPNELIITRDNAQIQLNFDDYEIGLLNLEYNFLIKNTTNKTVFKQHLVQKFQNDNTVLGGETYIIHKINRDPFDADANNPKIDLYDDVTITAQDIGEVAFYNWYDNEGNLIFEGKDLFIANAVAEKYKLEVITLDGFKDYKDVEISLKPNRLETLYPNPASSGNLNIKYKINEANSAYIMITSYYMSGGISNNYIIDKDATEKKIDLGLYPNGFYKVALITDGQIVDVKILSKL